MPVSMATITSSPLHTIPLSAVAEANAAVTEFRQGDRGNPKVRYIYVHKINVIRTRIGKVILNSKWRYSCSI